MARREKVRLNLEFTPRVAESLERLIELSDSHSRTEVIRKALSLFDVALNHREKGGEFVLKHADGKEETLRIL